MFKTIVRSPITTIVLFLAAAALLVVGGVGTAQAALSIRASDYTAQVQLDSIDTALVENGSTVGENDALLGDSFLGKNGINKENPFKVGETYDELLAVRNSGIIDEYVRVTVTKYWTDKDGKKIANPEYGKYIELTWGDDWSMDENVSTDERVVLYYPKSIAPDEITSEFVKGITISEDVKDSTKGNFQGAKFHVDVTADAVQTHNGTEAMTGAWGRTV